MSILNWEAYHKANKTAVTNFSKELSYSVISEKKSTESLEEFAKNRLAGASKIAQNAKEKGGDALLTYQHFKVKLPYYKKAAAGKFDLAEAKKELAQHLASVDGSSKAVSLKQMDFQRIVGQIEVLGELIIKHNETPKAV